METLYTKDGVVKTRKRIVVLKDGFQIINPTEEQILADGWTVYTRRPAVPDPDTRAAVEAYVVSTMNARTDMNDDEAVDNAVLVYDWARYLGKSLKKGQIVSYAGALYRVYQDVPVVLEDQYPSINTAALYESINVIHEGTVEDPIPYVSPMEIYGGKYYSQDMVVYVCIRDSEQPLTHNLAELVGIYVSLAEY